jgi:hypothetical protein
VLIEFTVFENSYSQNGINSVVLHKMFLLAAPLCSFFRNENVDGNRHASQLQLFRYCIQPSKGTSLIQFSQFISKVSVTLFQLVVW